MIELKMFKTHRDVKLPEHATQESACFDLSFQVAGKNKISGYSRMNKPIERIVQNSIRISSGDRMLVPTGLILDIPLGYSVRIHARSGLSLKQGLVLANAEAVIDSDYVEELFIMVHNISDNALTINNGDRIAQGELVKNVDYEICQTALRPLPRGDRVGGLGSTGVGTITKITDDSGTVTINIPNEIPYEPESFTRDELDKVIKETKENIRKAFDGTKKVKATMKDPEKEASLRKRRSKPSHRSTETPTKGTAQRTRAPQRKKPTSTT